MAPEFGNLTTMPTWRSPARNPQNNWCLEQCTWARLPTSLRHVQTRFVVAVCEFLQLLDAVAQAPLSGSSVDQSCLNGQYLQLQILQRICCLVHHHYKRKGQF